MARNNSTRNNRTNEELNQNLQALVSALKETTRERKSRRSRGERSPQRQIGNRTIMPGFGAFGEALGPVRRGQQDANRSLMFGRGIGAISNRMGFEVGGAKLITGMRAGGLVGGAMAAGVGLAGAGINALASSSAPGMTEFQRTTAFYDSLASSLPFGSALRQIYKHKSGTTTRQQVQNQTMGSVGAFIEAGARRGVMPSPETVRTFAKFQAAFEERVAQAQLEAAKFPELEGAGSIFQDMKTAPGRAQGMRDKARRLEREGKAAQGGFSPATGDKMLEAAADLRRAADNLESQVQSQMSDKFGPWAAPDGR